MGSESEGYVFGYSHVREESVRLNDDADTALCGRQIGDVSGAELDGTGRGGGQIPRGPSERSTCRIHWAPAVPQFHPAPLVD